VAETSAGAIIGTLRLDISDFEAGIAEAQASAARLDGRDVNVDVRVDSAGAETKLAAVAASEDKVDRGNTKIAQSGHDAGRGMGAMATAIITLGPALVPLAAGAAGLAVGFGAMGAAGILAVVGIANEMKSGSTLGASYTAMVGTLKGNLTTLSHTAAAGVLQPFQVAVADLQTKMPKLNSIIGDFSVITGRTAGALTTGLVSAFIALAPLAEDAGVYVLTLSQRFAALMSSGGVTTFGDYVRGVFPQVMQAIESIVTAAVRLVAAFAPLGLGTLGMLRTLADVINAIPVDVLATLASVAGSVYLGFKSFALLSVGITAVGTALEFVGVSAETAAVGLGMLNIAAGAVAVIVAVAAFAYNKHAEGARQAQEAVNSYTDALIRSNGAIDANVREVALKHLTDSGAIDDAKALGLNLSQVTDVMLGNVPASQAVGAQMLALTTNSKLSSSEALVQAGHINKLSTELGLSTGQFAQATQAQQDHVAAMTTGVAATSAESGALQRVAAAAGTTVAALSNAAAGQKATADQAANAAAKMYLENDAAAILRGGLDLLNGKALGLAQATTADAAATNSATTALKTNGTAINGNSAAAVANQQALQNKAAASQREAEAVGKATGSTKAAITAYKGSKTALEGALRAQGLLTPAVQRYIDKLYAIDKLKVKPTKLDIEKAAAEAKLKVLQDKITAIKQGRVPGIDANTAAGRAKIAALQREIDVLHGKAITIEIATFNTRTNTLINRTVNRPGVTIGPANGAILTGFAQGGIQGFPTGENHIAQIAPAGAMRLWAEPETGGEAYIPLAPSKRARSLAIYDEVGKKLGASGGGTDMTGVRADLALVAGEVRGLGDRFGAELQRQARTIQTMQRQMA